MDEVELILGISFVFLLLVFAFIIALALRYRKKRRETEKIKARFETELLHAQLEIQEQTLKNISQEIHDNIGQMLSLVKLNLATIDIEQKTNTLQKVDDCRCLVKKVIQDLRNLSKSFNTDYVSEMGLLRSIEYEVEMLRKIGIFSIDLNVTGQVYKVNSKHELILFRIIQEILNNILKHAEALRIEILMDYTANDLTITIRDNGRGFDMSHKEAIQRTQSGLGFRNMANRAKLINADLCINSVIGGGTEALIKIKRNTQ